MPKNVTFSKRTMTIVASIAVLALILCIVLVVMLQRKGSNETSTASATTGTTCNAVTIAKNVLPSVVTIHVQSKDGKSGSGSGEFIDDASHVLTNDHVISAGAQSGKIAVVLSDGTALDATLVGRATRLDLAVLKVTGSHPAISIGNSSKVTVGQPVIALGAPLGLSSTVTSGIVSALGRQLQLPADGGDSTAYLTNAMQTDASINPGNSGGALVNCAGELIGINTAIATVPNSNGEAGGGNVGIGFSIPSDTAMRVAKEIIENGSFTPPSFGVAVSTVNLDNRHALYITQIVPKGAADLAGLKTGDVITSVKGLNGLDTGSLVSFALNHKAGDTVAVTYLRDGVQHTTNVTLQ